MEFSGREAFLLRGGHDSGGAALDVLIDGERIAATGPQAAAHPAARRARPVDLTGRVLLPAAAEPHAHLDKALLGRSLRCDGGSLADALVAMRDAPMSRADVLQRAAEAARTALVRGFTAIRSHVDLSRAPDDAPGVRALAQLRQDTRGLLDLQLAVLVFGPVAGPEGLPKRRRLRQALELGCDVIGGAPWLDADPEAAVDELTAAAAEAGLPVDLHLDETTDAGQLTLARYISRAGQLGLGGRATASHCVSLGQQDSAQASDLARAMASAGVSLVVLPQTNLCLQGRGLLTRVPRALPPLALLERERVQVAAGGDNWRDPFNPVGRIDPMETASLLVTAGHVTPQQAYDMVSGRAREVLGLPPAALAPGHVADLLAIRAATLADAVADGTEDRMVWHRGRLVANTTVRSLAGSDLLAAGPGARQPYPPH